MRKIKDKFFTTIIWIFGILTVVPLILILYYIFSNGISAISLDFFTKLPAQPMEGLGGISNALIGSILLVVTASLIAIPFGIILGIYLSENKNKKRAYWVSLAVDILQGIPSIVIGIIIYIWVVLPIGHFSALSGSLALAILMIPVIVKNTEEALNRIPNELKEASLALGTPYYVTLVKIILPSGFSGILTGIMINISRAAGETAPLLFTAFGNPFTSIQLTEPIHSLPLLIYNFSTSPYDNWQQIAWGASVVLISVILILNLLSKWMVRKWKVQL